ncbi:MAG: hypothetical protein IJ150_05865 [Bacteroidales bacterium]|nr:hypothetical protein [Bacteroidales bacterium]
MFGLGYYVKFPWTKMWTIKEYYFETREDRSNFLMARGKNGYKWWEKLPFVERYFWIEHTNIIKS